MYKFAPSEQVLAPPPLRHNRRFASAFFSKDVPSPASRGRIALGVQMHEALYVLLQEGRAHARNGDAVAVAELEHCAAVHIRGDRRRQLLHILNVGEMVKARSSRAA